MQEAGEQIEKVLHDSPLKYGVGRSRWRLKDLGHAVKWLDGRKRSCVHATLQRLGFTWKQAVRFVRSPDSAYRQKWTTILACYADAIANPKDVVLLFQDELTYYRRADVRRTFSKRGQQQRHLYSHGVNTQARISAALNARTGQLLFLQRYKIGNNELALFYAQIRAAYPDVDRIYLVQDNWPVHKTPTVLQALSDNQITPLFLPTYASWLNPIEKLWRWLRQDLLHNHTNHRKSKNVRYGTFKQLRKRVHKWLSQFNDNSPELLHYVGLLSADELKSFASIIL